MALLAAEVTRWPVAPRVRRANAPRVSLWRLRVEDPSSQAHRASDWEARDRTGESDPLPFKRKDLFTSEPDGLLGLHVAWMPSEWSSCRKPPV